MTGKKHNPLSQNFLSCTVEPKIMFFAEYIQSAEIQVRWFWAVYYGSI